MVFARLIDDRGDIGQEVVEEIQGGLGGELAGMTAVEAEDADAAIEVNQGEEEGGADVKAAGKIRAAVREEGEIVNPVAGTVRKPELRTNASSWPVSSAACVPLAAAQARTPSVRSSR